MKIRVGILRNNVMSGFYSDQFDGEVIADVATVYDSVDQAFGKASELNQSYPEGSQAVVTLKD